MRIASLLPSATEIVCALGAASSLVGRSHECDWPVDAVADVPVVTSARALGSGSETIDKAVRSAARDALAIYSVDRDALARAQPDVVITQDLCEVCAVPASAVAAALSGIVDGARLVRLSPLTLADVFSDIRRVADVIDRRASAEALIAALHSRLDECAPGTPAAPAPRVLSVEWLDPVMIGGLWTPELIALAGGVALEAAPGEFARTVSVERIHELDPDVLLFKPCGYRLADSDAERERLDALAPIGLRCRDAGRVFVADGNAYFNRSGPRLIDSTELLGALIHTRFDASDRRQREGLRRLAANGALVPVC